MKFKDISWTGILFRCFWLVLIWLPLASTVARAESGYCSGFFISPTGYIATAGHCDEGKFDVYYKGKSGTFTKIPATKVFVDHTHDIMILKADVPFVSYLNVEPIHFQGEKIESLGWPDIFMFGADLKKFPGQIYKDMDKDRFMAFLFAATGSSGGPVLNSVSHNVIGIVIAILLEQQGDTFSPVTVITDADFLYQKMVDLRIVSPLTLNTENTVKDAAVFIFITNGKKE